MRTVGVLLAWVVMLPACFLSGCAGHVPDRVDPKLVVYRPTIRLHGGSLQTAGSETMQKMMTQLAEEFPKYHDDVLVSHVPGGSENGLELLSAQTGAGTAMEDGRVCRCAKPPVEDIDIAVMSRRPEKADLNNFKKTYGYTPIVVQVGWDALAVIVHHDNPVATRGLSFDQLEAIFAKNPVRMKRIESWGTFGWEDAGIHLIMKGPYSGSRYFFCETIINEGNVATCDPRTQFGRHQECQESAQIVSVVADRRYSIGFVGAGAIDNLKVAVVPISWTATGAKMLPSRENVATRATDKDKVYPLRRALYLVLKPETSSGQLSPLALEFVRFILSQQGQMIVHDAGCFPIDAETAKDGLKAVGVNP